MENEKISDDKRSEYRLPFGIHKGKSIVTVPTTPL
jgi:hypothetical protein